jgi:hypothetical protein
LHDSSKNSSMSRMQAEIGIMIGILVGAWIVKVSTRARGVAAAAADTP